MALGKGTLTELEKLKAEHGPKFKAEAQKRRKTGPLCLHFRCKSAKLVESSAGLRLRVTWCKRKRCPRKRLEEYLWLLEKTRHWRHQQDGSVSAFWRDTVEGRRRKLKATLRVLGENDAKEETK